MEPTAKKVLILSATPRRGGNSDVLCEQFARGAREAGHEVEKISLRESKINYCTGCGTCFHKKPCPQKDDMPQILDRMVAAQVIVMATPVYFYTMNAQMKTLIDRTCSRYTEITGKDFYFIMTAADAGREAMDGTIDSFRRFLSCLDDPREKGFIYGTGAWHVGEIQRTPAMQQALDMGKSI